MTGRADVGMGSRLPIFVLTGFLGAGKTTILKHLLQKPQFERSALIVNEVGDVGIDQLLVGNKTIEPILLAGGCICCTFVEDIGHTLRDLYERRDQRLVPTFDRVVIETTGLANPGPILRRLLTDAWVYARFRVQAVVGVADGVHLARSTELAPEVASQLALSDRIAISKADLISDEEKTAVLGLADRINPNVPIIAVAHGHVPADFFLEAADHKDVFGADAARRDGPDHGLDVTTASLTLDTPLPWALVAGMLDRLFARHGADLLRVKGVLDVVGSERPVIVHGVQGVFYPPELLDGWQRAVRQSRIVFIARGIDARIIADSFAAALAAGPFSPSIHPRSNQ
jgi:G3E family GTPase